jgi:hypothetical protein
LQRFCILVTAAYAAGTVALPVTANTILVDFAGRTYGPPVLPDGVGAEPTGLPYYNIYDPPATQSDGTFRFTAASAGFPLGSPVTLISDLKDSVGNLAGVSLQAIRNGGSAGIARDKYSGPQFAGFATEALQDMIFSNSNISNALTFVLGGLKTDETAAYTLTLASGRDVGTFGPGYEATFTVHGRSQSVDGIAAPGVAVFENVLPDSNGQIRFDFGDPASTSFAAYFSAMKIARNAFVPGDANLDGLVNLADFELLTDHFFSNVPVRQNGDLTFDGIVDYHDFGRWFEIYNAQGAGGTAGSVEVPEPIAGSALIVATVVATLCRSRKLACLVVLLLASGLQTASTYAQLPNFERQGIVIDPVPLTAPPLSFPHDDAIFSTARRAGRHLHGILRFARRTMVPIRLKFCGRRPRPRDLALLGRKLQRQPRRLATCHVGARGRQDVPLVSRRKQSDPLRYDDGWYPLQLRRSSRRYGRLQWHQRGILRARVPHSVARKGRSVRVNADGQSVRHSAALFGLVERRTKLDVDERPTDYSARQPHRRSSDFLATPAGMGRPEVYRLPSEFFGGESTSGRHLGYADHQ